MSAVDNNLKYLSYVAPAKDVVLNKAAKNEMLVVR
ncbi:phosphoglycerate mutase [Lactobacillus acidophilus]|jgi:phosphoglycerate mutase|nr:phosphoglycerate mutase [Lactobacillus crispatus]QPP16728.1 phosphoglycerate mutase [Lactobacillus crispatus]STX16052.1 phosphoglycerate mutase [Lactobacillus acidophilus]